MDLLLHSGNLLNCVQYKLPLQVTVHTLERKTSQITWILFTDNWF